MDGTANLAGALIDFQSQMPTVAKSQRAEVPTKAGGKYTYTYAGLADVMGAAIPLLTKCGLAFTACPQQTERGYELVGILLHSSGESIRGSLPIQGNQAQEIGSSITYGRRYLFGCLTGVVTDDDDDGAAASKPAARKRPTPPVATAQPEETGELIQPNQQAALHATANERGLDRDALLAGISKVLGRDVDSTKTLTRTEATAVLKAMKP